MHLNKPSGFAKILPNGHVIVAWWFNHQYNFMQLRTAMISAIQAASYSRIESRSMANLFFRRDLVPTKLINGWTTAHETAKNLPDSPTLA